MPKRRTLTKLKDTVETLIAYVKPYKEIITIVVAISASISGVVTYAVTYFATQQYVKTVECVLGAKFEFLKYNVEVEESDIALRTRLAGILPKLPATIDTRPLIAELEKDIYTLKDKQTKKYKELSEEIKKQAVACNPGVRVP